MEIGSARVPRAGLGVAPKPSSHCLSPCRGRKWTTRFSAGRRKQHAGRVRSPVRSHPLIPTSEFGLDQRFLGNSSKNARSGDRACKAKMVPTGSCRPRALTRRGGGLFAGLLAGTGLESQPIGTQSLVHLLEANHSTIKTRHRAKIARQAGPIRGRTRAMRGLTRAVRARTGAMRGRTGAMCIKTRRFEG